MNIKRLFSSSILSGLFLCLFSIPVLSQLKKIEPAFSHDAKQVVYVQIDGEIRELWTMNLDGTGLKYLRDADGARNPRFSPDGKKIVFSRWDTLLTGDVWIINADGSGLKQLTKTSGISEIEPEFAPSGSEIVFIRRDPFKLPIEEKASKSYNPKRTTKDIEVGSGVRLNLADGREVEFLGKDLKITRIFPLDEKFAHIGCACETESPKFNLKSVAGTKQNVFQLSADGSATSMNWMVKAGSLDSILRFRSARSAPRYIFEVSKMGFELAGDKTEIFLIDDRNSETLKNWGLIKDFDISADGSKVIVSGYRDKETVQKLWLYQFETKLWSELKPVQSIR